MRLSVVIPAYNEEHRLPSTLDRTLNFLNIHFSEEYELIVVNDGSTDRTARVVEEFVKQFPGRVVLISYTPNQGRGAAVRTGMKQAQGDYILETDADGSVDEEAILRFYTTLQSKKNVDVLMGSRNAPGAKILTHQSWLRIGLGYVFLFLARLVFGFKSTDYALGFKMFTRAAGHDIINYQYDNHFLAEAELAYTANKRGWRIKEMPVLWTDFRNSRVHPFCDSIRSLVGLGKIMQRAAAGLYTRELATTVGVDVPKSQNNFWQGLSVHAFIIITGLLLTTLVSFPQIIFSYLAGSDYRGINIPHFGSDGHNYIARGKEVLEGHSLGNLTFREGKEDGQDYLFTMNEYVLMAPIKLLGLSDRVNAATIYNIYNFIGVFIVILLIYFLAQQLSGNTFLSAATALFVIGGYSIIYNKTLFYIDFNIYGRPTFPYVSSLGFFTYLNLLVKSLRESRRRHVIWAGLALGWLFYSYFYAWTIALSLTGILCVLYALTRDIDRAKKVFTVAAVGVALGAYSVIKMLLYFGTAAGKQASYFLWATHGRQPVFSKIGFVTLLLFALYIYKRRRDQNSIIIGSFILGGWVALNQQLLTGRVVQYGHYYWFFIVPLSIIVSFYMLWFLLPWQRARSVFFYILILVVFLNTAVGQYQSLWTIYASKLYEQNYQPLIGWLQKIKQPGVILSDDDAATAYLFTIYTAHDLFWHRVGTVHTTPLQRFKDALFVYGYLNKSSR
ncbi:MAG: glycosyltransferase family 2 protein, partial [Candidatus Magasanikbacteria bacterium]|nr:glycosyltransferase family 2 protein [Candidatus Magasanikbacteria bacterium]